MDADDKSTTADGVEPDKAQARRTALMAHDIVIKFKVMGLPDRLDGELATLSTDLGDLWGTQKALADRLERFLRSPDDWETVGDYLVDLRATIDHMNTHGRSVRRPMNSIARYAYRKAAETEAVAES